MKVQVILGSTRPGRVSERVAKWAVASIEGKTEVELVDLANYPLSFFDEPISPKYNQDRTPTPEVQAWLDKLDEADAYVIVTPEYNRSIPAILKNALDHTSFEFAGKPVAIIGHGSNNGAEAVAALKQILPELRAITLPPVYFSAQAPAALSEEGVLSEEVKANPYGPQAALDGTADQLVRLAEALKPLRG